MATKAIYHGVFPVAPTVFDGSGELVPGVKAVATYGHTKGHTIYLVESKGQKMAVLGDLMHVAAVQFVNPAVTIEFDTDPKLAAVQRKKVYADGAKQRFWLAVAHLPFPGTSAPPREKGPKFFCWFDERSGLEPGAFHAYSICHDRAAGRLSWSHQGAVLKTVEGIGELGPFTIALGLMTEKDIVPGKGSVSCHGQGAVATWSGIRVKTEAR